ncbi:hypothetical protein BC835DRAFT_1064778 [Cytidiella melzeri]|nr:hypothetical protein BC835DRAFT_1064778 [Cytidiella melzeri]
MQYIDGGAVHRISRANVQYSTWRVYPRTGYVHELARAVAYDGNIRRAGPTLRVMILFRAHVTALAINTPLVIFLSSSVLLPRSILLLSCVNAIPDNDVACNGTPFNVLGNSTSSLIGPSAAASAISPPAVNNPSTAILSLFFFSPNDTLLPTLLNTIALGSVVTTVHAPALTLPRWPFQYSRAYNLPPATIPTVPHPPPGGFSQPSQPPSRKWRREGIKSRLTLNSIIDLVNNLGFYIAGLRASQSKLDTGGATPKRPTQKNPFGLAGRALPRTLCLCSLYSLTHLSPPCQVLVRARPLSRMSRGWLRQLRGLVPIQSWSCLSVILKALE